MEELEYKYKRLKGKTIASSNGYSTCRDQHYVDLFYFAAIYAYVFSISPYFLPFSINTFHLITKVIFYSYSYFARNFRVSVINKAL